MDGTDCLIKHQSPVHRERIKYYSYKFCGLGVRYKIAVCIQTGDIIFVNGPFSAGRWPDISILWQNLMYCLLPGERVEVDARYCGEPKKCCLPGNFVLRDDLAVKDCARVCHKTVNGPLKSGTVSRQSSVIVWLSTNFAL